MDDEPTWAADRVVAPTPGFTITIPETANEFAIKGNIIKIFYHGLNEITQEILNAASGDIFLYKTPNQAYQLLEDKVLLKLDWAKNQKTKSSLKKTVAFANEGSCNSNTDKIMARMDAMTMKMDARYKEFQSRSKQPNTDHHDDDKPMSPEEEINFMQTFRRICFYNDYRDHDSNRDNWRSSGRNDYNQDYYRSRSDDKPDPQKQLSDFIKAQHSTNSFVKYTFIDIKTKLKTTTKNHQASLQNLKAKFDRLANKQSARPYGSLPSNTQLNPKGIKILHSIEGTILKEKLFVEFDEFMAMYTDGNSGSESDTKEPPFEKITFNIDYKIKTSLKEPYLDLELKPLPDNLEYVFLEEPSFLPVKENQEKDKIGSKPDKNEKRGEAGRSQKLLLYNCLVSCSSQVKIFHTQNGDEGPEHADYEIVAKDQPYAEDASPIAQSPEYVPESDFEMHPEDDDDEDPEEDPVDYPADGGDDGDDEEESSEDEEDDEMDVEADEEEEEEHPAPADSVVVAPTAAHQAPSAEETEPFETDESAATPPPHPAYRTTARISILAPVPMPAWTDSEIVRLLAISSPPASPLSPWSSPPPQIPFPPLPPILSPPSPILAPAPPPSPIRSLGYRAAMIRLRDEAASTSPPPSQLPSASRREDRPEV
nr:hypothetical protein [Tanacetum cinerariifolium]